VKNTYDQLRADNSAQKMIEQANWIQQQPSTEGKKFAVEALNELKHPATIAELNQYVMEKFESVKRKIDIVILRNCMMIF